MLDPDAIYPEPSRKVIPARPVAEDILSIGPTAWGRNSTRVVLRGDTEAAHKLLGFANQRARLGHLINGTGEGSLEIFDLPYGAPGGVQVDFSRRYDVDNLVITAPSREKIIKQPFVCRFDAGYVDRSMESVAMMHDVNFGLPLFFETYSRSHVLPRLADFGAGRNALYLSEATGTPKEFYSNSLEVKRNDPTNNYTMFAVAKTLATTGSVWCSLEYGNAVLGEYLTLNTFANNESNYISFPAGSVNSYDVDIQNGSPYVIALVSRVISDVDGYENSSWYDRTVVKEQSLYINGVSVFTGEAIDGYDSTANGPTYMGFQGNANGGGGYLAQATFNGHEAMSANDVAKVTDKLAAKWGL